MRKPGCRPFASRIQVSMAVVVVVPCVRATASTRRSSSTCAAINCGRLVEAQQRLASSGYYDAVFLSVNGVPSGGIFDTANNLRCVGDVAWDAVNRWYGIVFPTSCMGIGSAYQWFASVLYEDVFANSLTLDE
eukprot:gene21190-41170_t